MEPSTIQHFIQSHQWTLFDEAKDPLNTHPDAALAYQDSFLRYVMTLNDQKAESDKPHAILHFYPLPIHLIYLGAKDKLLKNFQAACQHLTDAGYLLSLRPHGGLGVITDPGIINFSLVTDSRYWPLTIDQAYEKMIDLIQWTLEAYDVKIDSYEIEDSYCPGKYDVVLDGKKIGGIAQRRFKDAVTTAVYLSLDGDQAQRGQIMQDFYRIGQADDRFPTVNPASMANISDLIGRELSVADYQALLVKKLGQVASYQEGDYNDKQVAENFQPLFHKGQEKSEKIRANLILKG